MHTVEEWAEIRRLHKVEGWSKRAIAGKLGLNRRTVAKALASPTPPRYQRMVRRTILEPYQPKIHALLAEDPKISAVRIFELIQDDGYPGKISLVRGFVHEVRPRYQPQPVFLRMVYQPAEYAQVDWTEMAEPVLWQEEMCKVYAFMFVLCYSRWLYLEFSLGLTLWDFLRCHQHAFQALGGVPKACVYDNLSSVVKRRRGTDITLNETFQHFAGHYCFQVHPCWPGQAHEKGAVERPADYVKGNFAAGRVFADYRDLQRQGLDWQEHTANVRLHSITRQHPVDRLRAEKGALTPLPATPFDTDWVLTPKVSKQCLVRVGTSDYSVPHTCYRQPIEVRVDDTTVRIRLKDKEVACHARCYAQHQTIIDRSHYDAIWESRTMNRFVTLQRGFLTAFGLVGQHFYEGLARRTDALTNALRQLLELEQVYPHQDVSDALEAVMRQGCYDPAAVKYWLLFATEPLPRPPTAVPDTALIPVEERDLHVYDDLIGGGR
jgi:transposase